MAERTIEMEQPTMTDPTQEAVRTATDRAERAEAELAKLKAHGAPANASTSSQGVSDDELKKTPSPSTAANASPDQLHPDTGRGVAEIDGQPGGETELRKDPMMSRLLDALDKGTDVGHYGRLIFAMVARHFMPHEEVLLWMTKDRDFSEEQAKQMLHQVDGRDYNPPRRGRLLEWQGEQDFQFMDTDDPDSGNLYRHLRFPQEIYDHIGSYQEAKS